MYIAKETFTSEHNHYYSKGQEINSFVYMTLVSNDRKKFKRKDESIQTEVFITTHEYVPTVVNMYEPPVIDPLTAIVIADLIEDDINNAPVIDTTQPVFGGFAGGDGGGAGAGGTWNSDDDVQNDPDPVGDSVTYDEPDNSFDSDSTSSSDSYDSPSYDN